MKHNENIQVYNITFLLFSLAALKFKLLFVGTCTIENPTPLVGDILY